MDCSPINTTTAIPSPAKSAEAVAIPAMAEHYWSLETPVADLANASAILEMVMDRMMGHSRAANGKHIFTMSEDDYGTLYYALFQVVSQSEALKKQFYKAFDSPGQTH